MRFLIVNVSQVNTISYCIIPSILIIGANSLLIYEFIQSKKRAYANSNQFNTRSFRQNLRATVLHASVFSISFVVISFPRTLIRVLPFILNNNSLRSTNLTDIFDLQGNCYYVFNFFIMSIMNKHFYNEFKSLINELLRR